MLTVWIDVHQLSSRQEDTIDDYGVWEFVS